MYTENPKILHQTTTLHWYTMLVLLLYTVYTHKLILKTNFFMHTLHAYNQIVAVFYSGTLRILFKLENEDLELSTY